MKKKKIRRAAVVGRSIPGRVMSGNQQDVLYPVGRFRRLFESADGPRISIPVAKGFNLVMQEPIDVSEESLKTLIAVVPELRSVVDNSNT